MVTQKSQSFYHSAFTCSGHSAVSSISAVLRFDGNGNVGARSSEILAAR